MKETPMIKESVYIINLHHYAFRPGMPAKIIGVKMVTPGSQYNKQYTPRLAYEVKYPDGTIDQISFQSLANGEATMMTLTQMVENGTIKTELV